jgi:sporulation protein YlmC with PRC-barrel domain
MTGTGSAGNLIKLGDTGRTVADPDADVRGRKVVDSNNEEIGSVDDLLIDDEEAKVRFLRVGAGGFLGIGEQHLLVPVDAVAKIEPDRVHIDRDRARLNDVPIYDPAITDDSAYYENVYGWWGYAPYWGPGYVYPPYPRY